MVSFYQIIMFNMIEILDSLFSDEKTSHQTHSSENSVKCGKACFSDCKEEFDNLPDDKCRWKWVKEHQSLGLTVWLDNNDTYVTFNDDECDLILQFDNYLVWSYGAFDLLDAMGISSR